MTPEQRQHRVLAVANAAASLADPSSPKGQELRRQLIEHGPLSPEGVHLALRHHIAPCPNEMQLRQLLKVAGQAPYVHVVLSGNVFVAGVQAMAVAVAAAPKVTVRLSRRDSVFTRYLLEIAMEESALDGVVLRDSVAIDTVREAFEQGQMSQVHLYGRDATMVAIARNLCDQGRAHQMLVRAHGAGIGVGVVGARESIQSAAVDAVADIIAFDQRGCLSLRIVFVQGDYRRAVAFGKALFDALQHASQTVPLGTLYDDERIERQRYLSTCCIAGELFYGQNVAVSVADKRVWLPPVGRNVHVVACHAGELHELLRPLQPYVSALGIAGAERDAPVDDVVGEAKQLLPDARVSCLGFMQRPVLDGFVDKRQTPLLRPDQVISRYSERAEGNPQSRP